MKSKFNLLGVIALALVLVFTGSAFAWDNDSDYAGDADGMIFSYYDIRTKAQGGPGLSDNYFTIINEDDDEWYQMHIRVRTGQCSVELLDFDALLSPNDVFTFDLYQGENGATVFASCDTHTLTASQFDVDANGCFILDTTTFPAMLSLILECGDCPDGSSITAETALESTRWGYVEVIGEVMLCASDNTSCGSGSSSADECTTAQLEAGAYNAWTFQQDINDGGDCNSYAFTSGPDNDLFGKMYLAAFDSQRNLTHLGAANGWETTNVGQIIHRPCYSDNSAGCSAGDGEIEANSSNGWAYSAASTSADPAGANDLNYCFWKYTITSTGDVTNRVGAGATFGPTQADLDDDFGPSRDGTAATAENFIFNINCANTDHCGNDAVSHYFYIPGQGQSRYVFTFPFQHFINQEIAITKDERYGTEQEECTLPGQKFISPGLPAPGEVAGEVTIVTAHNSSDGCSFNEGWLEFEFDIVSDGLSDNGLSFSTVDWNPGVISMVVNWGDDASADVFDISPMHMD